MLHVFLLVFFPGAEISADAGHPQVARQVLAATDPADGGPAPPVARAHRLRQRHQEGRPACPGAREARSPGRLPGQGPGVRGAPQVAQAGRQTAGQYIQLLYLVSTVALAHLSEVN